MSPQKLEFKADNTVLLNNKTFKWTADGSKLQVQSPQANTWDGSCNYTIEGNTLTIAKAGAKGNCTTMYGVYTKQ